MISQDEVLFALCQAAGSKTADVEEVTETERGASPGVEQQETRQTLVSVIYCFHFCGQQ